MWLTESSTSSFSGPCEERQGSKPAPSEQGQRKIHTNWSDTSLVWAVREQDEGLLKHHDIQRLRQRTMRQKNALDIYCHHWW